MPIRRLIAVLVMALVLTGPALAADWLVMRLRGAVELQVDGNWVPLKRGDAVANEQMVRTLDGGHVELQRDLEIVTLGAHTEVRIHTDTATGYTTVLQDFGRVEVDAEAKRVKHFEVKNPYLAAVVKGTHFIVTSDQTGATVMVERGAVQVQSVGTERLTTIGVGQTATVARKSDLVIGGLGPWPAIVEPGVTRTAIVASLGGGLNSAPGATLTLLGGELEPTDLRPSLATSPSPTSPVAAPRGTASTRSTPAPAPALVTTPSAGVGMVTASSSTVLFGMAAANQTPSARASEEPSEPVSFGVVLVGALFGAVLGGLGLLLRRAM